VITEQSECRLVDLVKVERQRASEQWAKVDRFTEAGDGERAEEARQAAAWHERIANMIHGAVPELF
jgi:hypothetical protein